MNDSASIPGLRLYRPDDFDAFVTLADACAREHGDEDPVTAEGLAAQLATPGMDVPALIWVLPCEGGLAALCGAIPMPGEERETVSITAEVHPGYSDAALAQRCLRFAESRARVVRRLPHLPAALQCIVRDTMSARARLLEDLGYAACRWFLNLECDLVGTVTGHDIPAPFSIVELTPDQGAEELHLIIAESFQDHWNPVQFTVEQLHHTLTAPPVRPLVALVARDADGTPAATCVSHVKSEKNARRGTAEGEVMILGVRRPYRGRGLGRALLVHSLCWLKSNGMSVATIDVDANSPTGADRLYRSVGFAERKRSIVYEKPLPP